MRYSALSKYRSELMGGAMLWVMLFHASDLDMGFPLLELVRAAGFGGVDIFIVLSAVGLVASLSRKERSWGAFMARRCGRILPAYYIVMLPYTLLCISLGTVPLSALWWNSSLLYYWVQAEGAFNWYITGILLFYAVTPFFFRLLRKSKHREALIVLWVVPGLLTARYLIERGPWAWLDVAYRIPVFFLGLLLGFYVLEGRRLTRGHVLFWCAWGAAGAAYLWSAFRVDPEVLYLPLCRLFLFTTVPMCLCACLCFEKLPLGWLRKFLRLVGENSLEIYLLNVSFFFQNALLRQLISLEPTNRFYYLVIFAANIALGVLLHRAVAAAAARLKASRPSHT